jgi:uncharacterized protein
VVAITWIKPAGAEYAEVSIGDGWLRASGVAIGTAMGPAIGTVPLPYHLKYDLTCEDGYLTRSLTVHAVGAGWSRSLRLSRDFDGKWHADAESAGDVDLPAPGGDTPAFAGALDCDLGECPVTNTMPVLRQGMLAGGAPASFVMAWVKVPDLTVHASTQRYTFLRPVPAGGAVINYASGSFSADVTFDADGLVTSYPGLATRL